MLGSKKAVPLWRQRKPKFLDQDRTPKPESNKDRTQSERGVIAQTIARHRLDQAKAASHPARHRS